jgi:clan AA aspartic protease
MLSKDIECGSPPMGLVKVKVEIKNPETGIGKEVELLVDTGSVFTWVSRRVLEEIGIRPRRRRAFRTVDGRVVERFTSIATIRYKDFEGDVEVVFAEEEDAEVLGVTALETLGLEIDPVTKELKYVGHLAV